MNPLRAARLPATSFTLPAGRYEYVVVTEARWTRCSSVATDWKTLKGVRQSVLVSWIN